MTSRHLISNCKFPMGTRPGKEPKLCPTFGSNIMKNGKKNQWRIVCGSHKNVLVRRGWYVNKPKHGTRWVTITNDGMMKRIR